MRKREGAGDTRRSLEIATSMNEPGNNTLIGASFQEDWQHLTIKTVVLRMKFIGYTAKNNIFQKAAQKRRETSHN